MEAQALAAQQLYPPEPPPSFPPSGDLRGALADQRYPPEPPPSFPPETNLADQNKVLEPTLLSDADARGLRAEASALTADDLSRLSVGHATTAQTMDLTQLYTTAGLFLVVVGVLLLAVVRRKDANTTVATKKNDAHGRSVAFSDSYEPFLG